MRGVTPIRLADDQLEQLAELVAERLTASPTSTAPRLLTAAELAEALSIDRKTVYRRQAELGAIRIGGALRFDLATARSAAPAAPASRDAGESAQGTRTPTNTGRKRRTRRSAASSDCQLLPIGRLDHARGRQDAA